MNDSKTKLMTPANIVTLLRICFIPVFVIVMISPWPEWMAFWPEAEDGKPLVAAIVFILIAATDALDGYLARSRGEVTDLGKFMDPLADKILVAAALLALIELGVLPSWVALIILTREFIVSGIRMVAASRGVVIAASWWGKAKTVTQIIAIVLFILKDSHMVGGFDMVVSDGFYLFSWFMMIVALALTIISMLDYFVKARELLGFTLYDRQKPAATDASEADDDVDSLDRQAADVLDRARSLGLSIGTAESCTGGMIATTLTAVPGSSDVVAGGIVSYSNDVKRAVLGVREATLSSQGAVSEQTAVEMARGAQRKLEVDIAVSVTGIAGPGGAVPGKPVGTVWIGLCDEGVTFARLCRFDGDRDAVRRQTTSTALTMLAEALTAHTV